jgi:hypothetical protein
MFNLVFGWSYLKIMYAEGIEGNEDRGKCDPWAFETMEYSNFWQSL